MINSGHINLETLSKNYSFTAGIRNGKARIYLENTDTVYNYRKILKTGDRTWNFDGTPLTVTLRSETVLEVKWEEGGINKSETFVVLPNSVENIVNQEKERRQNKFQTLYVRGPSFVSPNYGTLVFTASGAFSWDEINSLPEGMISGSVLGSGTVDVDYELAGEMAERYTGALALRLNAVSGRGAVLVFAYTLDSQGLRMEHIPQDYVGGRTVSRRAPNALVIFFRTEA
jgi:hypothetical protein